MYGVRDDCRLRALERTGYPDGGMSAREEREYEALQDALDLMDALKYEQREMEEFVSSTFHLGRPMKDDLRDHYYDQIEKCQRDIDRAKEALGMR